MSECGGGDSGRPAAAEAPASVPAWRLWLAFFRLGLTSFGGPAMVAYIREMAVVRKGWLSEESFRDGAALCQSIPGATAMQTAAYVGLRAGGPLGALASFAGFGLPAFLLMLAFAAAYRAGQDVPAVLAAFRGLQAIVIAIIANAAVNFGRASVRNWRDALLAFGAAAFLALHGNPVLAIGAAAMFGAVLFRGVPGSEGASRPPSAISRRHPFLWPAAITLLAAGGMVALFIRDRRLFDLATVMLKVDFVSFGGGFASVPLMYHEAVDVRGWLEGKTFMDGVALGQVTPGPIVITATFVGYQVAGLSGALIGTAAMLAPSFFMVLATTPFLDDLCGSPLFRRALRGVLASFVGLLVAVAFHFGQAVSWGVPAAVLAAAAFAALRLKADILWVVLAGAAASVVFL